MLKLLEALNLRPDHPGASALAYFKTHQILPKSTSRAAINAGYFLAFLATAATPATPESIRRWLAPIVAGCKIGFLSEDELKLRITAIIGALKNLPEFCFTESTQVQVLRHCEFMPTAAEIWKFIGPAVEDFEAVKKDLNQMLDRGYGADLPSPEEIERKGWAAISGPSLVRFPGLKSV